MSNDTAAQQAIAELSDLGLIDKTSVLPHMVLDLGITAMAAAIATMEDSVSSETIAVRNRYLLNK